MEDSEILAELERQRLALLAQPWRLAARVAQHILEIAILATLLLPLCQTGMGSPFHLLSGDSPEGMSPTIYASAGLLFLALAAWVAQAICEWRAASARSAGFRPKSPLLALACLTLLIGGPILWASPSRHSFYLPDVFSCGPDAMMAWATLVLMLAVSRPFKNALACGLLLFAVLGCLHGLVFLTHTLPLIHQIRQHYSNDLLATRFALQPGILVSTFLMSLRPVVLLLLPFLAALYAVRAGFAWWKYLPTGACAWLIVYGTLRLHPSFGDGDAIQAPLYLVLLILLVRLPMQRQWLEAASGIAFSSSEAIPWPSGRQGAFASILAHGMVLLLVAMWAGFAVVCHYQRITDVLANRGIVPPGHSPALVNAFDSLKERFAKNGGVDSDYFLPNGTDTEFVLLTQLSKTPPALLDEVWQTLETTATLRTFDLLQPGFDAYEKAADADYCLFYDKGHAVAANFTNLRQVSLGLASRARLRIVQHRPAEALHDVETMLRFTWLMNGDPSGTLVHHMIASSDRMAALSAAEDYFFYYRRDPVAMELLRQMLERTATKVRFDFPAESIRRTHPAFGPVVPYFEDVPGASKAWAEFYSAWAKFDELTIAVALEAYRHDKGRYPDTLAELAPQYLARIPREPIDGQPYLYEALGEDVKLAIPGLSSAGSGQLLPAPTGNPKTQGLLIQYPKDKSAQRR